MHEPVCLDAYQIRLNADILNEFSWLGDSFIDPAPGHISDARILLLDIQRICGLEYLQSNGVNFLRIARGSDDSFLAYVDIDGISDGRQQAIRDAVRCAVSTTHRKCAECGDPTIHRQQLCQKHMTAQAALSDKRPSEEFLQSALEIRESELVKYELGEKKPSQQDQGPSDVVVSSRPPMIQVFSAEDICTLEKSANGRDTDTKSRITEAAKKLRATGTSKPLALIPENWNETLDQLAEDFPNFGEFFEFLCDQFALSELGDRRLTCPPILFDGEAGIGKTEVVLSIAEAFNTASMIVDMASSQCGSALAGSDAYWANSREGQLFETLAYGITANPIVILDELDKISGDEKFRPDGALYQLLEPRTAAKFRDLSVREICLDASHALWFATVNSVDRVSAPIQSRFSVFRIPRPSKEQTIGIAKAVYKKLIRGNSWGAAFVPDLTTEVALKLTDFPPREIRNQVRKACGRAARSGRRELQVGDVIVSKASLEGIGFMRCG